jgi:hypothetical protein
MMNLKGILFRDIYSKWYWITIALIVKFVPFILLLHNKPLNDIPGFWGGVQGDTYSYLAPIENFIKSGNYDPDFRMPGYGILFYPLLLLFTKAVACNIIIILQYIVAAVSVYYLALTAKNIFSSNKIFYIREYTE